MYHVELRQFPHNFCHFNLSDAELAAIVEPWKRGEPIEVGDRKWSPHQAKIRILEGPELALQELSMGRGWRAAERRSRDVTDRVLATAPPPPAATPPPGPAPRAPARRAVPGSPTRSPRWSRSGPCWVLRLRGCSTRGVRRPPATPRCRRVRPWRSPKRTFAGPQRERKRTLRAADPPTVHFASEPGGRSSVGRAPGCGPGGRGFESPRSPLVRPCQYGAQADASPYQRSRLPSLSPWYRGSSGATASDRVPRAIASLCKPAVPWGGPLVSVRRQLTRTIGGSSYSPSRTASAGSYMRRIGRNCPGGLGSQLARASGSAGSSR